MRNFAKRDGARRCIPKLLTLMLLAVALLPALSHAQNAGVSVPLMLAPDSERQGFVRIINDSNQTGSVRITAYDDAGTAARPIEIRLEAGKSFHFNSDDLANGNNAKGIGGIGEPRQGHWRLSVETALPAVQVLAFVRTRDGFLTAMHDMLPRDAQGRLMMANMLNPGSNRNQESKLRLVNTGANRESVSISGVDDQGESAGPIRLALNAGQSRTLSAYELENGASGLTGTLGDGAGKWRLLVTAGQSVVGMGLLETASGPITNISTAGVRAMTTDPYGPDEEPDDDHGNGFNTATNLAVDGRQSGRIDPAGDADYFRVRVTESGELAVYTTSELDTFGYLYDANEREIARNDDSGAGYNFRIEREVDAGTHYVKVQAYTESHTGSYTVHADFDASTEPPTNPPPTQTLFGWIRTTLSSNTSTGRPLNLGISWRYTDREAANRRAILECRRGLEEGGPGWSECSAFGLSFNSTNLYGAKKCGAAAKGIWDLYGGVTEWAVGLAGGDTLSEAQANALRECREAHGGLRNCELWTSACADGSHANSPSAQGGMAIRP